MSQFKLMQQHNKFLTSFTLNFSTSTEGSKFCVERFLFKIFIQELIVKKCPLNHSKWITSISLQESWSTWSRLWKTPNQWWFSQNSNWPWSVPSVAACRSQCQSTSARTATSSARCVATSWPPAHHAVIHLARHETSLPKACLSVSPARVNMQTGAAKSACLEMGCLVTTPNASS